MQTIHHNNFTEKLTTVIEQITQEHQPIYLELPNSVKAVILSEEDQVDLVNYSLKNAYDTLEN